jgi:hypothetical protein
MLHTRYGGKRGLPNTPPIQDWLVPLPSADATRTRRSTDVSQDPRYTHIGPNAADCDAECTSAPTRIPLWVLPADETQALFDAGYGTAPDLIYDKGVPDDPHPDQTNTDKKLCTLIQL